MRTQFEPSAARQIRRLPDPAGVRPRPNQSYLRSQQLYRWQGATIAALPWMRFQRLALKTPRSSTMSEHGSDSP
jgi:hypothetical protein